METIPISVASPVLCAAKANVMNQRPQSERQDIYNVFQFDKDQMQCKVGKIPYTSQIFDPDDFDPVVDDENAFYVRLGCGKNKDYDGKLILVNKYCFMSM